MAETVLITVVLLGVAGSAAWLRLAIVRAIADAKGEILAEMRAPIRIPPTAENVAAVQGMLERKPIKQQDSVFDRDTIAPMAPRRYVSLAVRRAQAESASMGPVTHDAKVRENNARAIESAG